MDEHHDDWAGADDHSSSAHLGSPGPDRSGGADGAGSEPRIERADPAADTQRRIDELTAVARAKAAASALAEAELIDAVAALRPYAGKYVATWRQWISWQCGMTSAEANRVCRLAEQLPKLPRLDAALRSGRLSPGVTAVLARDATPATEAEIMAAAEVATGRQLEQLVRDHRRVRRANARNNAGDDRLDPATAPSEVSWRWGDDGRHHGHWNLRPDDGATVEAALEAALAHLRPTEATIDGTHADAACDQTSESVSVVAPVAAPTAEGGDGGGDDEGGGDGGAAEQSEPGVVEGSLRSDEKPRCRRSDALVGLANAFLAGEADDGLLPESTQIILHRDITPAGTRLADGTLLSLLPDLRPAPGTRCGHAAATESESETRSRSGSGSGSRSGSGSGTGAARDDEGVADPTPDLDRELVPRTTMPGCGALDPRIAGLIGCDALVLTVEEIGGFPASEATAARTFNRRQRRALRARDRHCRYPGCRQTRHLHAHHTKPYAATHRTSVADGVLLCAWHHALVHLRGHTIELGVDHCVTVTRRDGSILRGVALPPPAAIDPPAEVPSDRRISGTHEPLTTYGRDVILERWLTAEPPDEPDPPEEPPAGPAPPTGPAPSPDPSSGAGGARTEPPDEPLDAPRTDGTAASPGAGADPP